MITICTIPHFTTRYFNDVFPEKVRFVNPGDNVDNVDFYIKALTGDTHDRHADCIEHEDKTIFLMERIRRQRPLRIGYCIDNKIELPELANFCFTAFDFCDIPYIITMPQGPISAGIVSQKEHYWLDYKNTNTSFHNKVYWCGQVRTHETRRPFIEFYNELDDPRFDITEFTHNLYRANGSSGKKNNPKLFTDHIERLANADACFILRGDKPFANSFFDVIMTGCIPIMISSMNYYGWENIFENVDDYMLRFDLREHSMEYIHEQVVHLLEDKQRVLQMKANIRKFYDMFFKHGAKFGFAEFLLAKCIEIYKNDFDVNKVDDKFISSEVLNLKGLESKL